MRYLQLLFIITVLSALAPNMDSTYAAYAPSEGVDQEEYMSNSVHVQMHS